MSFFGDIISGLTKAETFLVKVFTKTSDVDATFQKLAPATKAAILATFYDAGQVVTSTAADAVAISTGNIPAAIQLSAQTWALIQGVFADAKNDASIVKQDLIALGILKAK